MFFLADSGNKMDENDVITDYSCTEEVAACLFAVKHQVWSEGLYIGYLSWPRLNWTKPFHRVR